jgi:hypothetical protein
MALVLWQPPEYYYYYYYWHRCIRNDLVVAESLSDLLLCNALWSFAHCCDIKCPHQEDYILYLSFALYRRNRKTIAKENVLET